MKNKVFKAFCKVPMNLQLFAEGDGAGTGDDGGNGGGAGGAGEEGNEPQSFDDFLKTGGNQRGENSMSDIGGLDTVEETTEEKVVEMTEKKERKPFHYWTVNGRDYRLKLKASMINKLENKYRQNILNMLDDIPPLSVMLTIIQAAMEPWEHGLSYTKVQNLYDYWADEEGGNQTDLYSKIIIPTLAVSGFFTQEQADVLVEEMQNV